MNILKTKIRYCILTIIIVCLKPIVKIETLYKSIKNKYYNLYIKYLVWESYGFDKDVLLQLTKNGNVK